MSSKLATTELSALVTPSMQTPNTNAAISVAGEAKIIRNSQNEILGMSDTNVYYDSSSSSKKSIQLFESTSSLKSKEDNQNAVILMGKSYSEYAKTSSRGTMMMLPKRFLSVPRYRIVELNEDKEKISFTIIFNRKQDKLGITIQEMSSLIQVVMIHRSKDGTMLLAETAGVRMGDVLVGINGEKFGPWAELRDVMDLLTLSGHFVEIQFERFKPQSPWFTSLNITSSSTPNITSLEMSSPFDLSAISSNSKGIDVSLLPVNMKVFVDNGVVTPEQVSILDSTVQYLKSRVIRWSADFLADRIQSWHLDKNELDTNHDLSDSKDTNDSWYSQKSSPSSSSLSNSNNIINSNNRPKSSRRHSVDTAILAELLRQEQLDDHRYLEKYSSLETQNLRPALSLRLLRAEQGQGDFIVYVIWVMDVRSGVEWILRRRFREFEVFRETVVRIRKKLHRLDFPQKHLAAVTDKSALIQDRLNVLQRFLRRIAGIITLNSHHPSTIKLQLTLQRFLSVETQLDMIVLRESDPTLHLIKTVEVFIHNILHMNFMDKVLQSFIDGYMSNPVDDIHRKWTEKDAAKVAEEQKEFLDRLQNFLFDALFNDCADIVTNVIRESGAHAIPHKVSELIEQMTATALSMNQPRQSIVVRESKSIDSESIPNNAKHDSTFSFSPLKNNVEEDFDNMMALSSDEFHSVIRDAIRRQVEAEVYLATVGRIDFIMLQVFEKTDKYFHDRTGRLSHQPQTYFDIPVEHISPSSWEASITAFKSVTQKTLPCDKINALLDVSRGIFHLYRAEHPEAGKALGADDLLPIFIYVMVQANIPNMVSLLHMLQYLCAEDKRMSEAGYYLATLQASVTHIMEADLQKERPFFAEAFSHVSDSDED